MKKILFSLLLLSFLSTTVMAQQPMRATSDNRNKEMRANKDENKKHPASATEAAKAQAQQMKTLLQLSDSQCRKIYPILLRNHQNDSVMNAQIGQMRKEQKNRHKNQCEEIKKILTPEQQAAMMAMPAFAGESGRQHRGTQIRNTITAQRSLTGKRGANRICLGKR